MDKLDVQRVYRLCDEYNRFRPFGESYDRSWESKPSPALESGKAFEKTIRELERVVEEARLQVKHKCEELEHHLDEFIVAAVSAKERSYTRSNLLSEMHMLLRT